MRGMGSRGGLVGASDYHALAHSGELAERKGRDAGEWSRA